MATASEIRDRAANDLGMLRLGQSLQAQDSTRITDAYTEVYAKLRKNGLATWASTAEVPDEVVPHVVAMVARNCLNTYSCSQERYQRIMIAAGAEDKTALREIRCLVNPDHPSMSEPDNF